MATLDFNTNYHQDATLKLISDNLTFAKGDDWLVTFLNELVSDNIQDLKAEIGKLESLLKSAQVEIGELNALVKQYQDDLRRDFKELAPMVESVPGILDGAPVVAGTRLPTLNVYMIYLANEEDVQYAADCFDITFDQAKAAIEFEKSKDENPPAKE